MNIELLELMPKEPYRGILPFRLLDWRIFFEREAETERLTNLVSLYRGVLLYGQSGAGKSSLLNAGLIPRALRQGRAPERIRVYPESEKELFVEPISLQESNVPDHSGSKLPPYLPSRFTSADTDARVRLSCGEFEQILHSPSKLGVPLLIFDQFEELVTLFEENPTDKEHFEEARAARVQIERMLQRLLVSEPLPVKLVFAFRDDYLARLTPLFSRIPNLMDQGVRLALPGIDLLHHLVRGPFLPSVERGITLGQFGDELSEDLALKIEDGIRVSQPSGVLNLSEVQTICLALWKQPRRRAELLRAKDPPAVLRRIIKSEAMASLRAKFYRWNRVRAIAVLSNLVTDDGTRNVVSHQMLVSQTRRNPVLWLFRGKWRKFLERLSETGLVRRSLTAGTTYHYELTSESLIPQIQRWQQRLRMQRQIIVACIGVILIALPWSLFQRARNAEQESTKEKQEALDAEAVADNLRKRTDSLVGLISVVEKELTGALESTGNASLAKDLNKQLAEYRKLYAYALPKTGSWKDRLNEIRSRAGRLKESGDSAGAIQLYLQAFDLAQKELARGHPEAEMWLSTLNSDQGDVLMVQGNLQQAKERFLNALDIDKKLAEKFPDDLDLQRELAISYWKIGDVQRGHLAGALQSYRDGLAITERLAKQNPDNVKWQRDLSVGYNRVGDMQRDQGDLSGALQRYSESFAIAEKLAKQDDNNLVWQEDLALSYQKIGDVQRDQGDLSEALQRYRNALTIAERLAKRNPSNANWQVELAFAYERVGDVQRDQADLAGAFASYRDGFAIVEKLAKRDPGNAFWQRALAVSHQKIGDVLKDQADLTGALKSYRDSVRIDEKLAKQDPGNEYWQRGLAMSYQKVGEVLRNQADLAGAFKSHRDGLEIRKALAKQDSSNAVWQSDLAISFDKIGDVLTDQRNLNGALESYRDGVAILEKLSVQDPTNARCRADLSYSYFHVGLTQSKVEPNLKQQAQAAMIKGRDILRQLKNRKALTTKQQKWLTEIEAELGKAKK